MGRLVVNSSLPREVVASSAPVFVAALRRGRGVFEREGEGDLLVVRRLLSGCGDLLVRLLRAAEGREDQREAEKDEDADYYLWKEGKIPAGALVVEVHTAAQYARY